jgi:hypothetical protein
MDVEAHLSPDCTQAAQVSLNVDSLDAFAALWPPLAWLLGLLHECSLYILVDKSADRRLILHDELDGINRVRIESCPRTDLSIPLQFNNLLARGSMGN